MIGCSSNTDKTLKGNKNNSDVSIVTTGPAPTAAKLKLVLSGVDITSNKNSAVCCKRAAELIVTLTENTENILTDVPNYTYDNTAAQKPNATVFSKGNKNIGGSGRLTVNADFNNATGEMTPKLLEEICYEVKTESENCGKKMMGMK